MELQERCTKLRHEVEINCERALWSDTDSGFRHYLNEAHKWERVLDSLQSEERMAMIINKALISQLA